MNIQMLRSALASLILSVSGFANAGLITDWEIIGNGVISSTELAQDNWVINYNNDGALYSGDWTVSATAIEDGDFTFDWSLIGHHSWYQSQVKLTAFSVSGSELLASGKSGFNFSETYTFTNIEANETFGFNIHGYHYDSSRMMHGEMTLAQVPEPSTLVIFALGIMGLASRRFKKQS